ncbi:hypothetical protein F2P81_015399 [Scophthalmus maximus]|uniref:Uncharacterized protein n=1 Tax=Scophthalmus maximus TaxID=52904 RepID=A0A6A4SKL1_SCOMX|nr:hypothetical protein F2P81_015399 [Scophthalmus maximus]
MCLSVMMQNEEDSSSVSSRRAPEGTPAVLTRDNHNSARRTSASASPLNTADVTPTRQTQHDTHRSAGSSVLSAASTSGAPRAVAVPLLLTLTTTDGGYLLKWAHTPL